MLSLSSIPAAALSAIILTAGFVFLTHREEEWLGMALIVYVFFLPLTFGSDSILNFMRRMLRGIELRDQSLCKAYMRSSCLHQHK
ncbi:MAG: hypothetical protein LZF62_220008 [Nitrospira sp.]|nr:MAG: hypothetical protein LZF62_220008 [Nitrospira sp.]